MDSSDASKPKRRYDWRMLLLLPLWVTVAFVAGNLVIAAVLFVLKWLNVPISDYLGPNVVQAVVAVLVYSLTIGIVIYTPYRLKIRTSLADLGLTRLPSWTDIGLAPVGFVVYSLLVASLLAAIVSLLPSFPIGQEQDVGFEAFGSRLENLFAFVTLVVLAPFAEELLFRGYLYGKLKKYIPAVAATLATSLLFAVAHGQLNVGVDVFVLSLILCTLRSITGSIWAGVLVHVIKNGLAYYFMFVAPLTGM